MRISQVQIDGEFPELDADALARKGALVRVPIEGMTLACYVTAALHEMIAGPIKHHQQPKKALKALLADLVLMMNDEVADYQHARGKVDRSEFFCKPMVLMPVLGLVIIRDVETDEMAHVIGATPHLESLGLTAPGRPANVN